MCRNQWQSRWEETGAAPVVRAISDGDRPSGAFRNEQRLYEHCQGIRMFRPNGVGCEARLRKTKDGRGVAGKNDGER